MEKARRSLAATNLQAALIAANEALRIQPGDTEASELSKSLTQKMQVLKAEAQLFKARTLAKSGDRVAAISLLDEVLKLEPENIEAKQLQADLRKEEQAQAEEARQQEAAAKRERHPGEYFKMRMQTTENSSLFDEKEVKVKGNLADIERKLVEALTNQVPAFKLLNQEHPDQETFYIQAQLAMKGAGWRRCDLVGGQSRDGEVTLVYKVFEYAYPESFSIRALVRADAEKDMMPIHPSRLGPDRVNLLPRRAEGMRMVFGRISNAVNK